MLSINLLLQKSITFIEKKNLQSKTKNNPTKSREIME